VGHVKRVKDDERVQKKALKVYTKDRLEGPEEDG
jgi:hypothetical protein